MVTIPALDDEYIREVLKISGHRSKKAVVTEALREYIQRRKQPEIVGLFSTIEYDSDYDYRKRRRVP